MQLAFGRKRKLTIVLAGLAAMVALLTMGSLALARSGQGHHTGVSFDRAVTDSTISAPMCSATCSGGTGPHTPHRQSEDIRSGGRTGPSRSNASAGSSTNQPPAVSPTLTSNAT